ncbi:MAG: glycoside hydrolase family 2 TIM barrel-domain containing protein [Bryobacteraceae bacterium]|jgi:beta-glucuronidase
MLTRRRFFASGAAVPLLAGSASEAAPASAAPSHSLHECVSLNGSWLFRLDPDGKGEAGGWALPDAPAPGWREVCVPHTWQVESENTEYYGVAWYRRTFDAPRAWSEMAVRVEFDAVFHTAAVWANGQEAGRHIGKGYTAFAFDVGPLLRYDAPNSLVVKVDNAFNEAMLPRGRSSDWAHDGGIYRPVQLLITPQVFIERLAVDADPDIAARSASIQVEAVVRNTSQKPWDGTMGYRVTDDQTGNETLAVAQAASIQLAAGETKTVALRPATVRDPRLWRFDQPDLYTLSAELAGGHALDAVFGIRKIEIRGASFYLNGEKVRLMGVERMAGSNPEYGMAEPAAWIAHDHADMKELNCVYTRVHWPQDRAVLDWCDRHGMFIQTEIPTWGSATFRGMTGEPSAEIMNNGLEQLREMIARDRNHPCIFSWGMCNEIGGQNPPAYAFAKRMYGESKRLDPKRLVSYASNSLFTNPSRDVSGAMDYVMCNEYVGSWQAGTVDDLARILDDIHRAFPTKPVVVSEYGYCACTPERPEGDGARIAVLLGHDQVFRERDYVAGLIFFCYNDYRTHVGDRGVGAMKQRVHGVVDVYGARKPSYEALRAEASPLKAFDVSGKPGELRVQLETRGAAPAYALRGYKLRTVTYGYGNIPVERIETSLPAMEPGERTSVTIKFTEAHPIQVRLDVLRPTGFSAHTAIWKP